MWGLQQTIEIGSWYDFTSVSFRTFQGKFLSTTKDTQISMAVCTDTTCTVEETMSESITAQIIGAKVKLIHLCLLKYCLADLPQSDVSQMWHILQIQCNFCAHICQINHLTTCNDIKTVNIENQVIQSAVQIPHTGHNHWFSVQPANNDPYTSPQLCHPAHLSISLSIHKPNSHPNDHVSPPTPTPSSDLEELECLLKEDFPSENDSATKTTPLSPPHPLDGEDSTPSHSTKVNGTPFSF